MGDLAWPCSGIYSCASSTTPGDGLPRHVFSVWHTVCAGLLIIGDIRMLLHSRVRGVLSCCTAPSERADSEQPAMCRLTRSRNTRPLDQLQNMP